MDWVGVILWAVAGILFILCVAQWWANTHR